VTRRIPQVLAWLNTASVATALGGYKPVAPKLADEYREAAAA